jgi:hypothetical protein
MKYISICLKPASRLLKPDSQYTSSFLKPEGVLTAISVSRNIDSVMALGKFCLISKCFHRSSDLRNYQMKLCKNYKRSCRKYWFNFPESIIISNIWWDCPFKAINVYSSPTNSTFKPGLCSTKQKNGQNRPFAPQSFYTYFTSVSGNFYQQKTYNQ